MQYLKNKYEPELHASGADPEIFEKGSPEAIIYRILERRDPKFLKMLLNAHFSHFLINLPQIFLQNPPLCIEWKTQSQWIPFECLSNI